MYHTCTAIRQYVDENPVEFAFDFHSPKHLGGSHDKALIVYNMSEDLPRFQRFVKIFKSKITKESFAYDPVNDIPPNTDWNKDTNETFARYVARKPVNHLAFTLETPYFGEADGSVVTTLDSMRELGRCFAEALREYMKSI